MEQKGLTAASDSARDITSLNGTAADQKKEVSGLGMYSEAGSNESILALTGGRKKQEKSKITSGSLT